MTENAHSKAYRRYLRIDAFCSQLLLDSLLTRPADWNEIRANKPPSSDRMAPITPTAAITRGICVSSMYPSLKSLGALSAPSEQSKLEIAYPIENGEKSHACVG